MSFAQQFSQAPNQSPLDWFTEQMEGSGLTQHIVDKAQIVAGIDGYTMPYFDRWGNRVDQVQKRLQFPGSGGKCIRVEGVGSGINYMYWTPTADHTLDDISTPIIIVEGEKKALALQAHLLGNSIPGSVVGCTGVTMWEHFFANPPPMYVSQVRRPVYICFDFNSPKIQSNKDVRWQESKLAMALNNIGADVKLVRWQGEGEQKIDDWLVAGGKWQDIETQTPEEFAYSHSYFNSRYAKYDGKVIRLLDAKVLTTNEFKCHYSHRRTLVGKKYVEHAKEWLNWSYCPIITGLFFEPVHGEFPEVRDGKLNLFTGWDVEAKEGDVGVWLEFLDHLGIDEWARCWLAHLFQKPQEQPASYLAIFSNAQGVGKGTLVETLAKLLGKYAIKATEEIWLDKFNGGLSHALLLYTDELVLTRQNEQNKLRTKIKEICGNDKLTVRAMRTDTYEVGNYVRLIFTGNTENLVYIDQKDRRASCYRCETDLGSERGTAIRLWVNDHLGELMHWMRTYDISGWDAKGRAPESDAKNEVREASMSPIEAFAEWLRGQEVTQDVLTGDQLCAWFRQITSMEWNTGSHTITRKLRAMGVISKARQAGDGTRLVAVRNLWAWEQKETKLWQKTNKVAL